MPSTLCIAPLGRLAGRLFLIGLWLPAAGAVQGQQATPEDDASGRSTASSVVVLPISSRFVWSFDAGPIDRDVAGASYRLGPATGYDPASGFGWTRPPAEAFVRQALARSRDASLLDGVAGRHLQLRVDAPPGYWRLILWLDIRDRTAPPPRVVAGGQTIPVAWPSFRPDEEGPASPSKLYSVTFARVEAGQQGVLIDLSAPENGTVRVLRLALLRDTPVEKSIDRGVSARIAAAGRHRSEVDLGKLCDAMRRKVAQQPNDPWAVYWQTRLELLQRVEELYAMGGWQSARDATGLGMFDRLYLSGVLLDGLLGEEPEPGDPLVERARFLRGRLLYWLARQRGGKRSSEQSRRDFEWLARRYPDDPMLAMYLGNQVDVPDACDLLRPTPGEPAWSNAQREALCRMRQVAHWWVRERQSATGEFGGKWGDDVELLRWWAPLAVLGDQVVLAGWQKLADGVWDSRYVSGGYAARSADVEHAAEFVADTASLLAVCSDDPIRVDRLRPSLDLFRSLWTDVTPQGTRLFRSAWFSSTVVDDAPPKGRDVEYNTRAVQPIRYLAWRTGDRAARHALLEWSHAWRRAALRTDKQKPRGIFPASIRFLDESFNGDGANWYDADMAWPYYQWEHHCGTLMLDQLLFTYDQTKEDALLDPLRLSLQLVRSNAEPAAIETPREEALAGSPEWAARRLRRARRFWNVVEQWRMNSDDDRWDDLIRAHGTPYGRYRVSGDEKFLVDGLDKLLEGIRYNTPLLTTEALHTDRVDVPGAELVKAMLTGDQSIGNLSPYYAVTWEQTDDDFTALVRETGADRLQVELYSHASEERCVAMRVWQLAPGRYQVRYEATPRQDPLPEPVLPGSFCLAERGERVWVRLPPQRRFTLTFEGRRSP